MRVCPLCGTTGCFEPRREDIANQRQGTRGTAPDNETSAGDNNGNTTGLPNSSVTIACGGSGSVNDWAGDFLQQWACLPAEFGDAALSLAVTGNSIDITDEDPPSSGNIATYQATMVPGNPHVMRGFFVGGDPGNTYREDFSWTLSSTAGSFSQISYCVYLEDPNQGSGG